ncbi:hypothetical protein DPMN_074467 [Dreissena polymorpha]|uniref:Uncharacterized protein n=1 Tax=Dreissena polymorpha TaxID=45954 RepID=A0A9D4BLQ1_DREPO|nr:hypothetical protein DPMN_074467 [Dreissena polymorpha]
MQVLKQPLRRYQENVDQEIDQCVDQEKDQSNDQEDDSSTMILDNNEEVQELDEIVDDVGCAMERGYSNDVYDYNNNSSTVSCNITFGASYNELSQSGNLSDSLYSHDQSSFLVSLFSDEGCSLNEGYDEVCGDGWGVENAYSVLYANGEISEMKNDEQCCSMNDLDEFGEEQYLSPLDAPSK